MKIGTIYGAVLLYNGRDSVAITIPEIERLGQLAHNHELLLTDNGIVFLGSKQDFEALLDLIKLN